MVKTVSGVSHEGLRDWIIQRVSAIIMAFYTILLVGFFISHSDVNFSEWQAFIANPWMKITSILFLASTLYHGWVGMWTVFTDYVKPPVIRMILNFFVLLLLFALLVWGIIIIGSV